ncbi:MAG TPA: TonB-dependent receptor [Terracidiphilus sp.]|jgi:TonB-dependent receptor|nr:TonB-dependent receptor [Terracidiphilus sp.]
MHKSIFRATLMVFCLFPALAAQGQAGRGAISGAVKDSAGAVLQGAKVEMQPALRPITTNGQGDFFVNDVPDGTYQVTVTYVGFAPFHGSVTVTGGQVAALDVKLQVANRADEVVVTADRPHGEAEAINRTLAAENILQVLPADVITSLPNANIADALGRMPSVSIERDEGEGKYVQIRGTEPRLSNTMVDGVTIPSPESGVRQIKLDTIASDLVDSVEINKTLQANIDGDGIGGSVNLVTKTASDSPTIVLYGIGGYTHIIGGRDVYQGGATLGKRFLTDKKLGALAGFTYDYNGRGINDIEPVPTPGSATPHYDSQDMRDYIYNRTRWGVSGSTDYKLSEGSGIALRALFSTFRNWGNKWAYTMNDGATPQYSQDWRRPNMAIGSLNLAGHHAFGNNTILWNGSVARSRSLSGSGGANFSWVGDPNAVCTSVPGVSVNRPGWASCIGSGVAAQDNAFDRNNYGFVEFDYPTFGESAQVNLEASGSYARMYHFGTRYGTFEFGAKIRNAHKFDNTYNESICTDDQCGGSNPIPIAQHPEWYSSFSDPVYYDGTYGGKYPAVTSWGLLRGWVQSNVSQLSIVGGPGVNGNNFDLIERIPAGYFMNTIELASRVRLVAGLRVEATHVDTTSFDQTSNTLSYKAGGDYTNILPSASLRFALDKDSDLRLVYGRGVARPDPQDISAAVSQPTLNQTPVTISIGNPNLKAEQANDYDLLYERSLTHTGLVQIGYFYKDLTEPIAYEEFYSTQTFPHVPPGTRVLVTEPINAGSAYVQGFEIGYQQRMAYLPGVMGGFGLSANYSHTASEARDLPGRSDHPALLRDAPNVWNISPTYDTSKFSMRIGMTYDSAMIYQYQWQDGLDPTGVHGPSGDNYLYGHFQFDTQASYNLPKGFQVYAYGLNLNNEVFGFYNGGPQYVVQREYYHPTYAAGLRLNIHRE